MADIAAAWDQLSAWYQANAYLPTDVVHYGNDVPDESELRLCGDVKGKRVLELGCGAAQNSIAFAKQGAKAIGVDASAAQLAYGRRLAEAEEVKVELHEGDLADLGFVTSGSIDLAFSANSLNFVDDINRAFRQVHRVLKADAPFVFSVPHPVRLAVNPDSDPALLLRRALSDNSSVKRRWNDVELTEYPRSISTLFTGLQRANFRVDTILEPETRPGRNHSALWREVDASIPPILVMRARKLGV
jgi:SAM-dependent methyltransferase